MKYNCICKKYPGKPIYHNEDMRCLTCGGMVISKLHKDDVWERDGFYFEIIGWTDSKVYLSSLRHNGRHSVMTADFFEHYRKCGRSKEMYARGLPRLNELTLAMKEIGEFLSNDSKRVYRKIQA